MANKTNTNYVSSLELIRKGNKQRLEEAGMRWNEFANGRSSELSKQLFTISSFILPLSFFPLSNSYLQATIDNFGKYFLAAGWILFVLSLICGLIHISREADFFNKWAKQESNRSDAYSQSILTLSPETAFERLEVMNKYSSKLAKMKDASTRFWLYSQETALVGGIISLCVVLIRLLKL